MRLSASGRFIALKESSYDLPRVMEKLSAMEGKITLYSGNDDMVHPLISLGAQGVVSVVANIAPAYMSPAWPNACLRGEPQRAGDANSLPAAGTRAV